MSPMGCSGSTSIGNRTSKPCVKKKGENPVASCLRIDKAKTDCGKYWSHLKALPVHNLTKIDSNGECIRICLWVIGCGFQMADA